MYREMAKGIRAYIQNIVEHQRDAFSALLGEQDNSSHESYGRIKDEEERSESFVKPLGKSLKDYWTAVTTNDDMAQSAVLRVMKKETEDAIYALVRLAAAIERAHGSTGSIGQMSIGDVEVDEETGEVL